FPNRRNTYLSKSLNCLLKSNSSSSFLHNFGGKPHPFILMRKIITLLCIASGIPAFSQVSTALTEKQILASMDENASYLLSESKANSVSIGVLSNGKSYTKHYGEIDKGAGNTATN